MKKILFVALICLVSVPLMAADNGRGRNASPAGGVSRKTASKNTIVAISHDAPSLKLGTPTVELPVQTTATTTTTSTTSETIVEKDMRDKERSACISNNIGSGNTFVWASKFSDTSNYAMMVEDTDNPENNVCFARVELKSEDSRVSLSDIKPVYYQWGNQITCGAWADKEILRKRILDAKKGARVGATIGASVGGAALGVGAMELFGNKLIGGKVEGQAALSGDELLRAQILTLKSDDNSRYTQIVEQLKILRDKCKEISDNKPDACKDVASGGHDYDYLLKVESM